MRRVLADLNEAIRLDSKVSSYYGARGAVYANLGEMDKALADLNEAIRLDAKNAEVFMNRSHIYGVQGDMNRAIRDLDQAIRLDPKLAEAYAQRSWWRQEQARKRSLAAILANPKDGAGIETPPKKTTSGDVTGLFDNYGALPPPPVTDPTTGGDVTGFLANAAGDHDVEQALADINEAIRLDPKVSWYYKCRADIYQVRREIDKALADLSEAIRLDPKDGQNYQARAKLYTQKHDAEKAAADTAQAARLQPAYGR